MLCFSSCDYFKKEKDSRIIARVNEHYLYMEDLDKVISDQLSPSDSAMRAKKYIDNWAIKKIMLDRSKFNLPESKQSRFDSLAKDYQEELYREAYKNALINNQLDADISDSLIRKYYKDHKRAFKINEYLLKLRYIELVNSMSNKDVVLERFCDITRKTRLSSMIIRWPLRAMCSRTVFGSDQWTYSDS